MFLVDADKVAEGEDRAARAQKDLARVGAAHEEPDRALGRRERAARAANLGEGAQSRDLRAERADERLADADDEAIIQGERGEARGEFTRLRVAREPERDEPSGRRRRREDRGLPGRHDWSLGVDAASEHAQKKPGPAQGRPGS
jgi:hypothetical protein